MSHLSGRDSAAPQSQENMAFLSLVRSRTPTDRPLASQATGCHWSQDSKRFLEAVSSKQHGHCPHSVAAPLMPTSCLATAKPLGMSCLCVFTPHPASDTDVSE